MTLYGEAPKICHVFFVVFTHDFDEFMCAMYRDSKHFRYFIEHRCELSESY